MGNQDNYAQNQGLLLINTIVENHGPIFTTDQAYSLAREQALSKSRTRQVLSALAQSGWIMRLKRGVYLVQSPAFAAENLHPFAIATALIQPIAISHWSALAHHGFTTQIPPMVQASTPSQVITPEMRQGAAYRPRGRAVWRILDMEFEFIQIRQKQFFGFNLEWMTSWNRVSITDPERTMLDMVSHPDIFGGITVAIETLNSHIEFLNIEQLVSYSLRYEMGSVIKRMGWILESLGISSDQLSPLQTYSVKNNYLLDTQGLQKGKTNRRWNIIQNITGEIYND
ncbi:MAG: type IV toxin-antitoxin system AbiEi family antitoxin domain-containing protein [Anaerolineales bacterium]|nr:type IV toxin-antitoxin system AbiEi family antitoxin domain-containing protein [Anaerolineales bacterium]